MTAIWPRAATGGRWSPPGWASTTRAHAAPSTSTCWAFAPAAARRTTRRRPGRPRRGCHGHARRLFAAAGLQAAVGRLAGRRQSGRPGGLDRRAVPRLVAICASKPFEQVYSQDQLLTNVMIYVMTGSFTTGAWYYRGLIEEGGLRARCRASAARRPPPSPISRASRSTGAARALRRARLQHRPLERAAARRPLRGHGGAGPVRRGRARLGEATDAAWPRRYDFASDNVAGAMPEAIEALAAANAGLRRRLRRPTTSPRAPPT